MANLKLHVSFNLPAFVKQHLKAVARNRYTSYTAVLIESADRYLANRGLDQEALKDKPHQRIGSYTKSKLALHEFLNKNNLHVEDESWKPILSHFELPIETIEAITDGALYHGLTKTAFLSLCILELSVSEVRKAA